MNYSIKWRILAAVLLSQFLLGLTLSVATVVYSRSQWLTAFDAMLAGRAETVIAEVDPAPPNPRGNLVVFDWRSVALPPDDVFEVRDQRGTLVWRSKGWDGPPASVVSPASSHFQFATTHAYRGVVFRNRVVSGPEDVNLTVPRLATVAYASSTVELDARIRRIELFAALASLLLMGLTSLLGAWGVNKGLAPMHELAGEAGRISPRNWSFHAPPSAQRTRELAPLVRALEGALTGLERAFRSQRDFIADAAHELRTAVAILKSSLQLLSYQQLSLTEYKAGMARCVDDCGRVEELVGSMLTLARAEQMALEGQQLKPGQPVELAGSCAQAVASLRPLAEASGVAIHVAAAHEVYVHLDQRDLQVLWINLLHNAIQYSPSGSAVSVKVRAASPGTMALMQIEDSGSGIPADQLPHVFQRFRRCDPSRSRATGGFGLGLSICKAIADAYGGDIQIENRNGCGTRVSVSLPAMDRPTIAVVSPRAIHVAGGKNGMNGTEG